MTSLSSLQHRQFAYDKEHNRTSYLSRPQQLQKIAIRLAVQMGNWARDTSQHNAASVVREVAMLALALGNVAGVTLEAQSPPSGHNTPGPATFISLVGRIADAAEKADHLEEFSTLAKAAAQDLATWVFYAAPDYTGKSLEALIDELHAQPQAA